MWRRMEFLVPVIEKGEWPSELEELCARLKVLGVGGGFEWHWPLINLHGRHVSEYLYVHDQFASLLVCA